MNSKSVIIITYKELSIKFLDCASSLILTWEVIENSVRNLYL